MGVAIRRILADDWARAKALRLRSLAESPDAFARAFDQERTLSEARWRERALANAEGVASIGFFAACDGAEVDLAVGVRNASDPTTVDLHGLWVAPEARRRGAARALIEAVRAWAAEIGGTRLALEVARSSHDAIALYEALGFERSGDTVRAASRCLSHASARAVI